jgi:hypothetical protein
MSKDRNSVIPHLEPVEDRIAPVLFVPIDGSGLFFPEAPLTPPRTGGAAIQVGSSLAVRTAPMALEGPLSLFGSTLIMQDGAGNVAVSWDGQPVHFFSGVNTIDLYASAPINLYALTAQGLLQQAEQINLIFDDGGVGAFFEHLPAATQLQNALAAVPGFINTIVQQLQPLLGAQLQLHTYNSAPGDSVIQSSAAPVPVIPI